MRLAGCIVEEDFASRSFDKIVRYAKSKKCSRAIIISASKPEGCIHLKVINLNDDRADLLVAHSPEELHDILLKC